MSESALREPDQIRHDCAEKLKKVQTSGLFTAVLGCLLEEHWTEPRIAQLCITTDRFLLARKEGDVGFNEFVGGKGNLI